LSEKKEGEEIDWTKWKEDEVAEGVRRIPGTRPDIVKRMLTDLETLDRWAQDSITLKDEDEDEYQPPDDNAMDTTDAPEDPDVASTHVPDNDPPPDDPDLEDPNPDENQPPPTLVIDAADFKALKKRIQELEKRVGTTTEVLKKKIEKLMGRLANDNFEWSEMKQRTEDIKDADERGKIAGKRGYKKARGRVPTHHYPTRFATSQADDVVEPSRKEYGDIEGKMKKLEERIEENQREIGRLGEELTKVEALAPKIGSLQTSFETFRLNQVRVNFSTFREFSTLKNRILENVEARLNLHSRDVANLNDRYNSLQALAIHLLGHNNATAGAKTRAYSYSPAAFPSNHTLPKMLPPSPLRKAIVF